MNRSRTSDNAETSGCPTVLLLFRSSSSDAVSLQELDMIGQTPSQGARGQWQYPLWMETHQVAATAPGGVILRGSLSWAMDASVRTPAVITRIEVRDISREQAREEIIDYVRWHPGDDAYDIAVALRLDGWLAADIVDELIDAGEFLTM